MCGRFAQAQTREEYLAYLAGEGDRAILYEPEPFGRYNVAPAAWKSCCCANETSSYTTIFIV